MVKDYDGFITPLYSKHLKMGGGTSPPNPKIKNAIRSKRPCNPKTLNLLYLPNPTLLSKTKHTISFRTLENGGLGNLETFKFYKNEPFIPSSIHPP